MIKLSESLSSKINKVLKLKSGNDVFEESQLELITELSVAKTDLEYLAYFKNLEVLEVSMFPSFSSEDIFALGNILKKVKSLKIKEQNAILLGIDMVHKEFFVCSSTNIENQGEFVKNHPIFKKPAFRLKLESFSFEKLTWAKVANKILSIIDSGQ